MSSIAQRGAAAWLLLMGLLSGAACAGRETTVTTFTLPQQKAPSWVGVRVEDVLRLWGEPTERAPDGEGGTILTYGSKSVVRMSASGDRGGGPRTGLDPAAPYPIGASPPVETEVKRAPDAVFHLSPKGVVYRCTISSSLLMSGKAPEPPPLPSAEAPPAGRD